MIFQHEQEVRFIRDDEQNEVHYIRSELQVLCTKVFYMVTHTYSVSVILYRLFQSKNRPHLRGEYNVYSTFQSHEPEFDYLKSLEIEEKINKIRWLPQQNAAHFLLSTNGKRFFFKLLCGLRNYNWQHKFTC